MNVVLINPERAIAKVYKFVYLHLNLNLFLCNTHLSGCAKTPQKLHSEKVHNV